MNEETKWLADEIFVHAMDDSVFSWFGVSIFQIRSGLLLDFDLIYFFLDNQKKLEFISRGSNLETTERNILCFSLESYCLPLNRKPWNWNWWNSCLFGSVLSNFYAFFCVSLLHIYTAHSTHTCLTVLWKKTLYYTQLFILCFSTYFITIIIVDYHLFSRFQHFFSYMFILILNTHTYKIYIFCILFIIIFFFHPGSILVSLWFSTVALKMSVDTEYRFMCCCVAVLLLLLI